MTLRAASSGAGPGAAPLALDLRGCARLRGARRDSYDAQIAAHGACASAFSDVFELFFAAVSARAPSCTAAPVTCTLSQAGSDPFTLRQRIAVMHAPFRCHV